MKNFKKLFIMSILAISSFVLCGMTTVKAAAFSLSNADIICDPAKLDKGSRATCYIVGIPSETGDSVHGYVSKAYSTKYLKLIGAQSVIASTDAAWATATSATNSTITSKENMPSELKSLACEYDGDGLSNVSPTSFGCGVFYSITSTNVFTQSTVKNSGVSTDIVPATYGIVGALIVELDENVDGNECGEVCVKTWRVPETSNYADYATCGNSGDNTNNCGSDTGNVYKCKEIHYNESGTITETGAFASYALLAACALIAVSAIALAKKNNKFSRI